MSHSGVLKSLIPLELGGTFAGDVDVEARALDAAEAFADSLLANALPQSAYTLLVEWERLTATLPEPGEPLLGRRGKVIQKLRELGDIKKPVFERMAAAMGYEVYIEEYLPSMTDWLTAGEELIVPDDPRVLFIWSVHVWNQGVYHFHAGQSVAGERLTWWRPATALEDIMTELRPAHVHLIFSYE